jgi:hypothetical protein
MKTKLLNPDASTQHSSTFAPDLNQNRFFLSNKLKTKVTFQTIIHLKM